ncbi:hypothetical protein BT63DRAFT_453775 [Microthyrium microscopicum]|uniref:Uncharacterized protein n=1 Tax=Microthyrium microscopicum TaxID=703497 RepID=A0A6A6UJY3_9PEZI|nr:hypothetical protein BT63DRAFT_453775 [Microthyrium microscopicum]
MATTIHYASEVSIRVFKVYGTGTPTLGATVQSPATRVGGLAGWRTHYFAVGLAALSLILHLKPPCMSMTVAGDASKIYDSPPATQLYSTINLGEDERVHAKPGTARLVPSYPCFQKPRMELAIAAYRTASIVAICPGICTTHQANKQLFLDFARTAHHKASRPRHVYSCTVTPFGRVPNADMHR